MLRGLARLPAHVINGLSVSIGIGLVQVLIAASASPEAARGATAGAMYASIPHLVDRAGLAAQRALTGGLIGTVAALAIAVLAPIPVLLTLGIALLVFAAMMSLGWGQRAGPLSFTVILAIVFALAVPPQSPWSAAAWTLLGAAIYALWALFSTRLLEQRYRTLAVAAALEELVRLLRSRAAVLEERAPIERDASARWQQIDVEAQLATLLQSARDLVFAGAERPHPVAHEQLLLHAIELRDLLFTSRLDLDLLGQDDVANEIRTRLARSLLKSAEGLAEAQTALELGLVSTLERAGSLSGVAQILDERHLPADDPRLRLLPAIASRQQALLDLILQIHRQLRRVREESSLSRSALGQLTAAESWPLHELSQHLTLKSPVLRHALRSAIALSTAHALASALPWATHPHWILLSVAVVLRGTFAQTLSRRNDRVVGTAMGCVLVLALVEFAPPLALLPLMWLAAGTAHAFVNVRYTLTATSATVMALLQARSMTSITAVILVERLADTVLGAGFAWGFSYVLPSWSRRTLPRAVEQTLTTLAAYANSALSNGPDLGVRQRNLREQAYGALDVLMSTLRFSNVEPERVRPPLATLVTFIDHAQSLMSHLSSVRLLLLRRAEQLEGTQTDDVLDQTRARVAKRLELDVEPYSVSPRAQPLSIELPNVPADRAAFPWLLRRLNVTILEAHLMGETGRSALSLLRDRSGSEFPSVSAAR
ncbi:MAG: FUSC family membrane protein [Polyangiaceae bacterium]